MCESDDDTDFNLVDFLKISASEDEEEEDSPHEKNPRNMVNKLIDQVAIQQIKEKMTYKGAAKMVNLMNSMPNAAVQIPLNRENIKNHASKAFDHRILVFCEQCDDLVEEKKECHGCKRIMIKDSIKCNYLVHIPIEPQIKYLKKIDNFAVSLDFAVLMNIHSCVCAVEMASFGSFACMDIVSSGHTDNVNTGHIENHVVVEPNVIACILDCFAIDLTLVALSRWWSLVGCSFFYVPPMNYAKRSAYVYSIDSFVLPILFHLVVSSIHARPSLLTSLASFVFFLQKVHSFSFHRICDQ